MSGYINVDAFEKRLEEERKYLILREQYGAEHILVHHAMDILVEFPTADVVEVKHGHWIRTDADGYCSVCKCDMPIFREDWDLKFCETNFCPNCGADMRDSND